METTKLTNGSPERRGASAASVLGLAVLAATLYLPEHLEERPAQQRPQAELGTLEGRIVLAGHSVPHSTPIENTTDPSNCNHWHSLEDLVISPTSRGVQNVILSLTDVPVESVPPLETVHLVLDNLECRFEPHAAVLTVGSTLEAVNSDAFLHTVHLYGPAEFNIALPFEGNRVARVLEMPGLFVVKCDVHAWMQAYLRVDPHPFHAVTDPEGSFRISGIPQGTYTLEGWHERLGRKLQAVPIEPGRITTLVIEYDQRHNDSDEEEGF